MLANMSERFVITKDTKIEEILDRFPYAVGVLDSFEVYFDPFTYITLKSTIEDAAGYNALTGYEEFLRALQACIDAPPPPEWKGG